MKKLLLILSLALIVSQAKSQIIITGYLADPIGSDDNYEYVQLMATEDITFSLTNSYSLVTCYNATATTPYAGVAAKEGWATAGGRTYKFNITAGSVLKGEFFYVGGRKNIWGNTSTDISEGAIMEANRAKWIVSRDYASIPSDPFDGVDHNNGINTLQTYTGLFPNSGRASGIAVFSTKDVSPTTVPIDVVFFQETTGGTLWSKDAMTSVELGYLICDNDLYSTNDSRYFRGNGKNTKAFANLATISPKFIQLGGVYDTDDNKWLTPRSKTEITLTLTSTLVDIEGGTGITTLPVNLVSFTAKAQANTVNLNWSTASETENSHFDITRSLDGKTFENIGTAKGNGTTNSIRNYKFTDFYPSSGMNYYQLRQVDFNGKSSLSKIEAVNFSLNNRSIAAYALENQAGIKISVYTEAAEDVRMVITNIKGEEISKSSLKLVKGSNSFHLPAQLSSGVYVASLLSKNGNLSTKFIKE